MRVAAFCRAFGRTKKHRLAVVPCVPWDILHSLCRRVCAYFGVPIKYLHAYACAPTSLIYEQARAFLSISTMVSLSWRTGVRAETQPCEDKRRQAINARACNTQMERNACERACVCMYHRCQTESSMHTGASAWQNNKPFAS